MYIQPLIEGSYFHIYNRGVNGEDIFKEHGNYYFFLQQYTLYCSDVLETFAYALLKNHFHLLVYVKENVSAPKNNGQGVVQLNASKQLSHFFNSYAQAVNKACNRTGPLFESPFERKLIDEENYLTSMIFYCHFNAQMHEFVKDFRDWEFSSYYNILENNNNLVASEKVLSWFGGVNTFEKVHAGWYGKNDMDKFIIE